MEVDFESSPAINYLSSPRRYGPFFLSAPTSPPSAAIPFHWELAPGTPKSPGKDFDFAFHVSLDSHSNSASADELFHGAKIRPLKPPPRLDAMCSPIAGGNKFKQEQDGRRGGRNRQHSNWRHRVTRSLSPFRFSSHFQQQRKEEEEEQQQQTVKPSSSFLWSTKGFSKKWSFKNFFLFRSASEGSADPLRKKQEKDVKNSSFHSTDSSDSTRKGTVSAHTPNKTSSQDLKRKTSLPYKQGVLGRLAFGPMLHALGNGSASFGR